jgi:hypothetical protein
MQMVTEPARVGISVTCTTCGRNKEPHGRSASMYSSGCDSDCEGYRSEPLPGCLWPGETDADFGYQSCTHSTRQMTAEEIAKWKEKEGDDAA